MRKKEIYFELFKQNELKRVFTDDLFELELIDHTWGGKDYLLLFTYLYDFLKNNPSYKEFIEFSLEELFRKELIKDRKINMISNRLDFFSVILAYCIESADRETWILHPDKMEAIIEEVTLSLNEAERNEYSVNVDIQNLKKYLPGLSIE